MLYDRQGGEGQTHPGVWAAGHRGAARRRPVEYFSKRSAVHYWALPSIASLLIFAVSFHDITLFRILTELSAEVIGLLMLVMVWYSYRYNNNHFLLFLGLGYGWLSSIDLAHTLAFRGIGLFPGGDIVPATQLWIIARFLQALLLLAAPLFLTRKFSRRRFNMVFGVVSTVAVLLVGLGYFPVTYVEGQGLTAFKTISEYVIISIQLLALAVLYRRRKLLQKELLLLISLTILTTIAAEYTLTLYIQADEIPNIAGHLLKLFSQWLLFVAIAQTMFVGPSRALARNAAIYENLPMPTIVVDEKGSIQDANLAARRAGQASGTEIYGQNCHRLFHHETASAQDCPVCKLLRDRSYCVDLEIRDAARGAWASYTLTPVDAENPHAGTVHIRRDISRRKVLEQSARDSQASYELIVKTAPNAIISIDQEQKIILFNYAAEKIFGYRREKIMGRQLEILIPQTSRKQHWKNVVKFIASGVRSAPMRGPFRVSGRRKSGQLFPAEAEITRQEKSDHSVFTVIVKDISEQTERENRLRKSEDRFRTLARVASDWVWEIDANFKFTYLSHPFKGKSNLSEKAVLGRARDELARPGPDDKNWQGYLDDLAHKREFRDFQYCKTDDNGEEIHFSVSGVPQFDAGGEFTGYIGVGRDITLEKRNELEIERQRNLFETIVNGILHALIFTDQKRRIVSVNPGFTKMYGYRQNEVIGRTSKFLFADPERYEELCINCLNIRAKIDKTELSIDYRRKNGKVFPGKMVGAVVRGGDGELMGFVTLISDMTDQMLIEDQLRQAQKMDAIGQLTGGIAHDFNNLLTVIIGNLKLLEEIEPVSGKPDMAGLLADTISAAKDGAELTGRLLAYSRNSPLDPANMRLDVLVGDVFSLASRTLRQDIRITLAVAGPEVGLYVDSQQFNSALLNLLLNAQDAMPDGGDILVKSHVMTITDNNIDNYPSLTPGKYVAVQVSDDGLGMTREVLEKACEPFFTTKEHGRGTGLGLSTVLGFTRQSAGYFRLSSSPGNGAVAEMFFPYVRMPHEKRKTPRRKHKITPPLTIEHGDRAAKKKPDGERPPLTILATEDDEDVRKLIVQKLISVGFRVLEASNGEEARQLIVEHPEIDMLLSDVIMPGGVNGYQLAEWTRENYPAIKILMVTGYGRLDDYDLEAVVAEFPILRKPFAPEMLITAVNQALSV